MYPQQSLVIHLDEPLGEVANAVRAREIAVRRKLGAVIDDDDINEIAMQTCIAIARNKLEEHLGDLAVAMAGPDGLRHLLVNQRHLHKKGIMFTVFVFSTIIADLLGLEFVWSSDCKYQTLEILETFDNSSSIQRACLSSGICFWRVTFPYEIFIHPGFADSLRLS